MSGFPLQGEKKMTFEFGEVPAHTLLLLLVIALSLGKTYDLKINLGKERLKLVSVKSHIH